MTSKQTIKTLISPEYVAVSEHETVAGAVNYLRKQKTDFQVKFAYIYVVDEQERLKGVLQTRDLLLEDPAKEIHSLTKESIASIRENAVVDQIIKLFNSNSFMAVPVVDSERHLVGVISRSNLETHLSPEERDHLRSLNTPEREEVETGNVYEIAVKRLPWLLISVTSGLVCSYILGIFIGKIESIVALILFVPIIVGLAGNVGTQSARITSRGLQNGQLSIRTLIQILGKETIVGFLTGLCAFLLAGAIAVLWKRYPIEGIALGLSIWAVSFSAGLTGTILPVTLRALRFSPNFGSGLFVLLICDMVALLVYFLISLSLVSPMLVIS